MNETIHLRAEILVVLDPRFITQGFKRRKDSFSWRRRASPEITHGLHLNFDLSEREQYVRVNPSVGVRHESIERALIASGSVLASASRERVTFARLLSSLAGRRYETDVPAGPVPLADLIWADWELFGLPALEEMSDLERVIPSLGSEQPSDWCCFSRSDRARLLPLALQAAGRPSEALSRLPQLRADISGRDQLIPPFERFESWFRLAAS